MYNYLSYQNHFSQKAFWKKVKRAATKAGRDLVFSALVLYYTLQNPDLPDWARAKLRDWFGDGSAGAVLLS